MNLINLLLPAIPNAQALQVSAVGWTMLAVLAVGLMHRRSHSVCYQGLAVGVALLGLYKVLLGI